MAKMIIEVGYLIALTLMSAPVLLMLALALATGKLTWLLVKDTKVALPLLLSVRVGYILHYPLSTKPHKMQMTLSINYSLHLNIGSKP
ncbi:hypothetical protein [uncultured Gammaproteobacteria bacterium]|nr:hypothetical protein [uncultured Gammaproteobacteria bacterium]